MNSFSNRHPAVLFLYFMSVALTVIFTVNPVYQLEALLGGIVFLCVLNGTGRTLYDISFYAVIFVAVALTNPIFSHNGKTPLFFMNGNAVTLEAIAYGVSLAVSVVEVIIWFKCFDAVMTSDKTLYLFGRAIPRLSLLMSMALRLIPLMKRRADTVAEAQEALGVYSSKKLLDKIKARSAVYVSVVSWALEHSIEVSISMRSRGYGTAKRTDFSRFRMRYDDLLLLACIIVPLAVVIAAKIAGDTSFGYFPAVSSLEFTPLSLAAYILFGILSFLPAIIEAKEVAVWKYCVSKI